MGSKSIGSPMFQDRSRRRKDKVTRIKDRYPSQGLLNGEAREGMKRRVNIRSEESVSTSRHPKLAEIDLALMASMAT